MVEVADDATEDTTEEKVVLEVEAAAFCLAASASSSSELQRLEGLLGGHSYIT